MSGTKKSAETKCDKCILGKTVIYMSNQILDSAISKMKKKTQIFWFFIETLPKYRPCERIYSNKVQRSTNMLTNRRVVYICRWNIE